MLGPTADLALRTPWPRRVPCPVSTSFRWEHESVCSCESNHPSATDQTFQPVEFFSKETTSVLNLSPWEPPSLQSPWAGRQMPSIWWQEIPNFQPESKKENLSTELEGAWAEKGAQSRRLHPAVRGNSRSSSSSGWAAHTGRGLSSLFLCPYMCTGLCRRKPALQCKGNHFSRGSVDWRSR